MALAFSVTQKESVLSLKPVRRVLDAPSPDVPPPSVPCSTGGRSIKLILFVSDILGDKLECLLLASYFQTSLTFTMSAYESNGVVNRPTKRSKVIMTLSVAMKQTQHSS